MSEGIKLNFNKEGVETLSISAPTNYLSYNGAVISDSVNKYRFNPREDLTAHELYIYNLFEQSLEIQFSTSARESFVSQFLSSEDFKKLERHFEVSKI